MSNPSQRNFINEDKKFLKRISEGEIACFWSIWNNHKKYLYNYCLRKMNNNPVDAQETLSISMLKAWEKLPNYAAKITNIKGWLTRLTQNVCIDFYRKKNTGFIASNDIEVFTNFEVKNGLNRINSPDEFIMSDELKIVISQEINNLKTSLKVPLIMRFVFHKSYQEIAETIQISEVNVRKRIQKARTLLKKQIKSYLMGCNHLESLVIVEEKADIFSDLNLADFLESNNRKLSLKDSNLEKTFYRLYTTHLETLPSPLLVEEMAYV